MTSQSGKQTITIHIIQRNKGTQTMEVGKLIECNANDFFSSKIMHKIRELLCTLVSINLDLDIQ